MAWVRALTADALVSLYILAICTGPSPVSALARARPLNTARAAFWASSGCDLPRRRRPSRLVVQTDRRLRILASGAALMITLLPVTLLLLLGVMLPG
jgi:hypothetical protein